MGLLLADMISRVGTRFWETDRGTEGTQLGGFIVVAVAGMLVLKWARIGPTPGSAFGSVRKWDGTP